MDGSHGGAIPKAAALRAGTLGSTTVPRDSTPCAGPSRRTPVRACRRWTCAATARRAADGHQPSQGGPRGLPGRATFVLAKRKPAVLAGGTRATTTNAVTRSGPTDTQASSSSGPASEGVSVASNRRCTNPWTLLESSVWSPVERPRDAGSPPIVHKRTINTVTARQQPPIAPRSYHRPSRMTTSPGSHEACPLAGGGGAGLARWIHV